MAKKPKTPPPPRPVQAPKRRYEPTTGGLSGRGKYVAVAAAAVLVAGVAIAFAATRGGGSADAAKQLAAAGCSFKTYADQGAKHTEALPKGFKYNSFPPTSGYHHPQPAVWGIYTDPVDEIHLPHNLEHGGVVVQYGSKTPSDTAAQLDQWYRGDANGLVVAPLPQLGDKIALTAWTHLATCSRFDAGAASKFRDAFRYKGPENIPADSLNPGQ